MKTVIIEGMHCQSCVKAVKEALEKKSVEVINVEIGKAEVEGNISNDELKETIENVGFDVVEVQE